MSRAPQDILKQSFSFMIQEGPQTRTYDEALRLHQRAAANLDHVFKEVRAIKKPCLGTVYLKTANADCAPPELQLDFLFKNYNTIARAGFVAHPDLGIDINGAIIFYGMDKLRSFIKALDQTRLNLTLAVFKWGKKLIGTLEPEFIDSEPLWYSFILAWMESIMPVTGFDRRIEFLHCWNTSRYDLVWFGSSSKKTMKKVLKELAAGKAPVEDDPSEFLTTCAKGQISDAEFARVGPSMALHFLIAHEQKKKEREEQEKAANEAQMKESEARLKELLAQKAKAHALEAQYEAWGRAATLEEGRAVDEETDDEEIHLPEVDDEDEVVEMDVDEQYPVPFGVDLTRLPWDADWMQALLNIDRSIRKPMDRLESGREEWIGQQDGHDTLYTKGDALADEFMMLMKL